MTARKSIGVVKTAQTENILKLVRDGRVVGSVLVLDDETAELRDHRDRLMGSFPDAATAIAEFERASFEEIELDL